MSGRMRNLVGAAYYLAFFLVIGYIFGNIAGVDLIGSMQNAVGSAILFLQQLADSIFVFGSFLLQNV